MKIRTMSVHVSISRCQWPSVVKGATTRKGPGHTRNVNSQNKCTDAVRTALAATLKLDIQLTFPVQQLVLELENSNGLGSFTEAHLAVANTTIRQLLRIAHRTALKSYLTQRQGRASGTKSHAHLIPKDAVLASPHVFHHPVKRLLLHSHLHWFASGSSVSTQRQ